MNDEARGGRAETEAETATGGRDCLVLTGATGAEAPAGRLNALVLTGYGITARQVTSASVAGVAPTDRTWRARLLPAGTETSCCVSLHEV